MKASTSKRGVWLEIAPTRRKQENDTLETMTGATLQSSGMMSWPTAVFWTKSAVTTIWWPAAQHFFIVHEWGRRQELIFTYFFFISCHSSFFENYLMRAARFFEKSVTMMQSDTHCLMEQNKMEIAMSWFKSQLWPALAVNRHFFSCLLATTGTILMSSSLQHDRQHVLQIISSCSVKKGYFGYVQDWYL